MSQMINILVADDHAIVRHGLKTMLESQSHFKVVAEAKTGSEAIEQVKAFHPDVAVLDIRMPGMSGIEACRQIVELDKGCKVIMLTAYADDELLFAAIQAGASGYILKLADSKELIYAVDRISCGESYLDSAMIRVVFKEIHKAADALHARLFADLTSQELAVLTLVAKGMTNRQIAHNLILGEGTVRNYVSSVLLKLHLSNRAEAAAFAVRHRLDELLVAH